LLRAWDFEGEAAGDRDGSPRGAAARGGAGVPSPRESVRVSDRRGEAEKVGSDCLFSAESATRNCSCLLGALRVRCCQLDQGETYVALDGAPECVEAQRIPTSGEESARGIGKPARAEGYG
jgi:hypothetical protein